MRPARNRGISYLEVVIAAGILAVVAFPMLMALQNIVGHHQRTQQIQRGLMLGEGLLVELGQVLAMGEVEDLQGHMATVDFAQRHELTAFTYGLEIVIGNQLGRLWISEDNRGWDGLALGVLPDLALIQLDVRVYAGEEMALVAEIFRYVTRVKFDK